MKIAVFQFSLFGINTYIVWDPNTLDCAVIDPGMINSEEEKALDDFISSHHLKVTHLINTHLHIDHAVGDRHVASKYGVPVEAHPLDAGLGARIRQQAEAFGVPEKTSDVAIDTPLHEGDIIKIGDGELKVLHVPGHSPGSIVLYDPVSHFIIAGDVLFAGSIGRTDLPGGNHDQLIEGIHDKLLTLPDETTVFPGHGPSTTIGEERGSNPYL